MAAAVPAQYVLERLSQLSTLNVKQTTWGYNGSNFKVLTEDDEVLINLNENLPNTIFRAGARRLFEFDAVDNAGTKLFSFQREYGIFMTKQRVKLYMDGGLVSVIHMNLKCCKPVLSINDAQDNPVLRLKGKLTNLSFFQLQTSDKTAIGAINKKFRGWTVELTTFKNDYIISVPADLAVTFKIAVIVACVFIDFGFHDGR
ncbi:hypothetical protein PYW08_007373 [Mythimna loreyi]|uniref:Uncharacterized protein n=1 Tax=Mythimna loreyi TaxID=667449 RepID=A0ACC2RA49_9NEOP|nr:hypothetical protein PYW08_007373 [Mythimna loreyi]